MNSLARKPNLLGLAIAVFALAAAGLLSWQPGLVLGQDAPGNGVVLKITAASIPADLKPEVTFTLADGQGKPLKISDADEGGLRFLAAAILPDSDNNSTKVVNYVVNNTTGQNYQFRGETLPPALASAGQAGVDSTGTFTDLGGGRFSYKFGRAVPADFNVGATHVIGGYVTRNARAFVSNDAFYFVPAGGPVETMREVVKIEACNACHDNLAGHGGTRRDTKLCVLCHTSQTTDPESGNPVEFKVMVHRIHQGAGLPSVEEGKPYYIIGFRLNVFDFSGIVWPQDTRNCTTCHQGAQASNYKTRPSAEACGACHDQVNFKTGANHPGGPQPDSSACATCHTAEGPEFGLSVAGAHTIPEKSTQLRGLNFEFVSLTNTKPGQNPTVVFNIKDKAGQSINPSELSSLSFTLSGPTTEYMTPANTENVAPTARPTGDGNWTFTFQAKIPDNASGTYAVGVGAYLATDVKDPSGKVVAAGVRDVAFNKVIYGAVTDAVPMPRKQVVDLKNCNVCHETLALHGGTRRNTEFCVLCHNPASTDIAKRTSAGGPMPPESIQFGRLIHRIHTGEEQENKPFVIYGGSPASPGRIELSEARFPTDRRNCTKCHAAGSNLLNFMREGAQPINITQGNRVVTSIPPVQAVCLGCHDGETAQAHAQTQTFEGQETCVICHNEGRDFAVSEVHKP